mmetsp:Transcript_37032/g.98439  ORF Transcript_37032/g.98439 Transcript_37032/m.98439 type:complete len:90 (+) Transcript_37032:492-761(+)
MRQVKISAEDEDYIASEDEFVSAPWALTFAPFQIIRRTQSMVMVNPQNMKTLMLNSMLEHFRVLIIWKSKEEGNQILLPLHPECDHNLL